jgi:signal transduction histidine kinase
MPEQFGQEVARLLPQLRIDELLDELQVRLAAVRSSRDRVGQLLEAVVGIGSGLDLEQALTRIVRAATTLVDARYGALGVIGGQVGGEAHGQQGLARFITVGLSQEQIDAIGAYPEGHGLLGELIRRPVPLRTEDLATHPQSYGFPDNHPPMHSFLGVPVRVREEVFGNLYLTGKKDGAPFDADDEAVLTALAAAAGVAIDNARLFEDSRRLYAEAQQRQEWLEITAELSRGLLSGEDADDVLAAFVQRVRTFTQADLALVAIPAPEATQLLIVAADGHGANQLLGTTVSVEETLLGHVYKSGHSAVADDVRTAEHADHATTRTLGLGPALIAPLGAGGMSRGALSLTRVAGADPFEPEMAQLTTEIAIQAAVVLELAQRRKDSEQLSLYADRDRIARDLHDLAIQRLFGLSMSLQGAYKITEKPAVAKRLAQGIADLDDTIKVIRSTIFALNTHELDQDTPSVRAAVIEVCEHATGLLGFPPAVRFTGPVDTLVTNETAEHLLAVLREALSNAARHAQATELNVDLGADGVNVTLSITDNGIGIPDDGRRSGLANLRERAEQLGGTFTATRGPDGGTALLWSVPAHG